MITVTQIEYVSTTKVILPFAANTQTLIHTNINNNQPTHVILSTVNT